MLFGTLITTILIVIIDVQIILAKLDFNDPESLPNMAPQMLYFFIPFIFLALAVFAALTNYLFFKNRNLKSVSSNPIFLGMSYGLIISFSIFLNLDIPVIISFLISIALTFSAVKFVTYKTNEKAL